jgi:hypothetical protein
MQFLKLIQLDSGIVEFLVGFYNRSMDNFICACFFFLTVDIRANLYVLRLIF